MAKRINVQEEINAFDTSVEPGVYYLDGADMRHPAIHCGPGLTKQSFKDDCDINVILDRYIRNETIPSQANGQPFYGDVSEVTGYREALAIIHDATQLFMQYPAKLRERFMNDPAKFVEFMNDESNREEAIRLGLVAVKEEPKAPEPMLVRVVDGPGIAQDAPKGKKGAKGSSDPE